MNSGLIFMKYGKNSVSTILQFDITVNVRRRRTFPLLNVKRMATSMEKSVLLIGKLFKQINFVQ